MFKSMGQSIEKNKPPAKKKTAKAIFLNEAGQGNQAMGHPAPDYSE
jgi:hypothetical protein